ncbi:MAG: hypothetical protein WCP97_05170 [bacterium]
MSQLESNKTSQSTITPNHITKNDLIADVVLKYPFLQEVFLFDYQVGCSSCMMAEYETIEQGLAGHGGLTTEDIDNAIQRMNTIIEEQGQKKDQ